MLELPDLALDFPFYIPIMLCNKKDVCSVSVVSVLSTFTLFSVFCKL